MEKWQKHVASLLISASFLSAGCQSLTADPFDAAECLDRVPKRVAGLKIEQGPRSELSIIHDMRLAVCNGQVLFHKSEPAIANGRILLRVRVEYNGEVLSAEVVESTMGSNELEKKIADFVMDTDFPPWARHKQEAIFFYPVIFRR
jgi:hypothetical protein